MWHQLRNISKNETKTLIDLTPFCSQVASLVSSSAVALTLLLNIPLRDALFPPPTLLAFTLVSASLSLISMISLLVFLKHSVADKRGLVDAAAWVVPRNCLKLAASIAAGASSPAESGGIATGLILGCALVFWEYLGLGASHSDMLRPRASSAFSSPTLSPSPSRHLPPIITQPPPILVSPRGSLILQPVPFLCLIAFAPLLLSQASHLLPSLPQFTPKVDMYWSNRLGIYTRYQQPFYTPSTLDVVFSHYEEPVDQFQHFIDDLYARSLIPRQRTRMIVYSKGNESVIESLRSLQGVAEVVRIPNVGREGETYLTHILAHYDNSVSSAEAIVDRKESEALARPLADHTMFLQDRESLLLPVLPSADAFFFQI